LVDYIWGVDINKLPAYYVSDGLKHLYGRCGIYFLFHEDKLEYIGRSVNIGNRLMSHHVFDRDYHDVIKILDYPFKDRFNLKNVERGFIRRFVPPRNINATYRQSIMQFERGKNG
jgi:hypothetical protein